MSDKTMRLYDTPTGWYPRWFFQGEPLPEKSADVPLEDRDWGEYGKAWLDDQGLMPSDFFFVTWGRRHHGVLAYERTDGAPAKLYRWREGPVCGEYSCDKCSYPVPLADEEFLLSSGEGTGLCECGGRFMRDDE